MSSAERPPTRRRIWRMSKGDPKGTYVDAGNAPSAEPKSEDERHSGWAVSSFELKYGLDVSDVEDTVPAALLDNLFNEPRS
jgi:hypothetical protein